MSLKPHVYCFISAFMALMVLAAPTPAAQRGITVAGPDEIPPGTWGTYHALIIGIDDYQQWPQLKTAVKDATALSRVLTERYGFSPESVTLRTDTAANRLQIISDIRALATAMKPSDNLLLYYAGHGQLDDLTGDGYWIPVDGDAKNPGTWIANSFIKAVLSSEQVQAKNVVVIADSCYSGTMLRGGPSQLTLDGDYMTKLVKAAAKRSRQVISSGGIEPVADGGAEGHSLFAFYLLTALRENDREVIDLENLFHTKIWKPVSEIGNQRPNVGRLKTPMDRDGQFVLYNQAWVTERRRQAAERQPQDAESAARGTADGTDRMMAIQAKRRELEMESRQLEMAAQRLALENQNLEMTRQLLAQKQSLELEKRKLEQEKKALENQKMDVRLEALAPEKAAIAAAPPIAAAAPAAVRAAALNRPAATIAILPVNLEYVGSTFRVSPVTLANALVDAVGERNDIRVSHSYFPDIDGADNDVIQLSSKEVEGVWRSAGFFSAATLDVDSVVALGKKFGFDYAYSVFAKNNVGSMEIHTYIVDVAKKAVHTARLTDVYYMTIRPPLVASCRKSLAGLNLDRR